MPILSYLSSLFSNPTRRLDKTLQQHPWGQGRIAIYDFLSEHIDNDQRGLPEAAASLPDEDIYFSGKPRWVAGGIDGAYGHHGGGGKQEEDAEAVFNAFQTLLKRPSTKHLKSFYQSLLSVSALDVIDILIPRITNSENLPQHVLMVGYWLASKAPDREPVKFGLAIVGLFQIADLTDLVTLLGRHDEFTLFSSVALLRMHEEPDKHLWELAKNVDGWGRIQIVERLAETTNPKIRDWMLRKGYKNSVMYEYLACICAETGDLLNALKTSPPDEELLSAAGDIINALIAGIGGPGKGMLDYRDGAAATLEYVNHCENKELSLQQFLIFERIHDFVTRDSQTESKRDLGWSSELCSEVAIKAKAIIGRDDWKKKAISAIEDNLLVEQSPQFNFAIEAARSLGIDVWTYYYSRQKALNDSNWYFLMQTDNHERIAQVIELAETTLPLEEVPHFPPSPFAQGSLYKILNALEILAQELRHYPGMGWKIIKTSLKSPSIRGRNMAIQALQNWGKGNWPEDAIPALKEAYEKETQTDVAETIEKLLSSSDAEPPNFNFSE